MVQYWGKIKVINDDKVNPFVAVIFAEDTIKAMQKTGMTGEVVSVNVTEEPVSKRLRADVVTVDEGGMKHKHFYVRPNEEV